MNYYTELAEIKSEMNTIVSLWKQNMPYNKNLDYEQVEKKCNWFYLENPLGKGKLWLLKRDDNNSVIGSIGISFRRFRIKEQSYLLGLAQNFNVDKNHRTLGPALMLVRKIKSEPEEKSTIVYGVPSSKAVPSFQRVGYKNIGSMSRFVKVLNLEKYLGGRIRSRIIAKFLAVCSNIVLRIISKEFWTRLPNNHITMHVEKFDESFDELWEKVKDYYPVIEERTSTYLNWRFYQCPYQKFYTFTLKDKKRDCLAAYLIYRYEENNTVKIVDFLSVSVDKYLYYLLLEFIKEMRKKKVSSILVGFLGNSKIKNMFKRVGFIFKNKKRPFVFNFGDSESELLELFQNEENIYLTSGDEND